MGALLTVAATLFSCYSISHPRYTYRRLAAVLHTLAAVCVLAVIQLVDGGARSDPDLWAMLDEALTLESCFWLLLDKKAASTKAGHSNNYGSLCKSEQFSNVLLT